MNLSLQATTLLIDPGHGGTHDTWCYGCKSASGKFYEKDLTLDIAQRLKKILTQKNIRVILTRETDISLSPDRKIDLQMRSELTQKYIPDIFISLHFNSADRRQRGFELYVPYTTPYLQESYALAGALHHALAHYAEKNWIGELGNINGWDRGIKAAKLTLFEKSMCPAVLIELEHLTNPAIERAFTSKAYRNKIAQTLARGIEAYVTHTSPNVAASRATSALHDAP